MNMYKVDAKTLQKRHDVLVMPFLAFFSMVLPVLIFLND